MDKITKSARIPKAAVNRRGQRTASISIRAASAKTSRGKAASKPVSREFPRITRTPGVMGGKPCIRGMRVTVGMIAGQISTGTSMEEMLKHFPYLEREDILQAIGYAGAIASSSEYDLTGSN